MQKKVNAVLNLCKAYHLTTTVHFGEFSCHLPYLPSSIIIQHTNQKALGMKALANARIGAPVGKPGNGPDEPAISTWEYFSG